MLVTIKAGSTIDGFKFKNNANQDHLTENALQMIAQGIAKLPEFDAEGWCEINKSYSAYRQVNGVIMVVSGGDDLFPLPAGYPLEHVPAALQAYQCGHSHGDTHGRIKLQSDLRSLLDIR